MTTKEIGTKLVELCKQGQADQAMQTLYSPDIVSVEAASGPDIPSEMKGIQAVMGKGKWWMDNHIIHSAEAKGPYPKGNQFIVQFTYDITNKPTQKRMVMDKMALYTVENDKIVREEFFYVTG